MLNSYFQKTSLLLHWTRILLEIEKCYNFKIIFYVTIFLKTQYSFRKLGYDKGPCMRILFNNQASDINCFKFYFFSLKKKRVKKKRKIILGLI